MRLIFLILSSFILGCSVIHVKDRNAAKTNIDTRFAARDESGPRRRMTILPFLNASSYVSEELSQDAREYFISLLKKTDAAVITDWQSLGIDKIEDYRSGSAYRNAELSKKLRNSGLHVIVVGTIKDLRTGKKGDSIGVFRRVKSEIRATVELQVISVRSGQVMASDTQEADLSESSTRVAERSYTDTDMKDNVEAVRFVVENAFEKTIPVLISSLGKFSWEGRVALVKGEKIYLNAGRQSGLQVGDILRIVEAEEEVYDPESSRAIGMIQGRVKGTVEVISYFGNDGAVTRIYSGSGFKENDLVEFY